MKLQSKTMITCVFITIIDVIFKYLAITQPFFWKEGCFASIVCLSMHKNYGIAFSIPIPMWATLLISAIIIIIMIKLLLVYINKNEFVFCGLFLIIFGALNNFVDRLINNSTTDYLIFFGLSAINLADILIVTGVFILLWYSKNKDK